MARNTGWLEEVLSHSRQITIFEQMQNSLVYFINLNYYFEVLKKNSKESIMLQQRQSLHATPDIALVIVIQVNGKQT